jgi:hydroxyethylthiazole kinase
VTDSEDWARSVAETLESVRQERPLVHHITNQVVMNDTANITLQVGARPVMARAAEEVEEVVRSADALVLNLGTPTVEGLKPMALAGRVASEMGIPIVLDPVGVGATALRDRAASQFLGELSIAIVRGNGAEIGILAGTGGQARGVDAVETGDMTQAVRSLALRYGLTAVATGERDWLSDGERTIAVDNGHPLLATVTGTGCMATTVIGAMAAVEADPLLAAVAGLVCFGVAAERAAEGARGPGSFKVALFDALYTLTLDQLLASARVSSLGGINE